MKIIEFTEAEARLLLESFNGHNWGFIRMLPETGYADCLASNVFSQWTQLPENEPIRRELEDGVFEQDEWKSYNELAGFKFAERLKALRPEEALDLMANIQRFWVDRGEIDDPIPPL